MVDDSSIMQYAYKKHKSDVSTTKALINASILEEMRAMEIELGMDG